MKQQHLSYRLTRLCMLWALGIGVLLSLLQIVIDGVRESARIDQRMQHSLSVVRDSAAEAVYNIDDELALRVVSGLASIDGVIRAQVSLPDRALAEKQAEPSHSPLRLLTDAIFEPRREYRLELSAPRGGQPIGRLDVVLDTAIAGRDFVSRSFLVVGVGLIRALVLAAVLMAVCYVMLTRPLSRLAKRLSRIDHAAPERVSFEVPPGHENDELGSWVRQINALLNGIRMNLEARSAAEDQADFLRQFDALTELPNRALFMDRLRQALESARRDGRELGVVFTDISRFQHLNDEHGFEFGDQVLVEVARRIGESQRAGDQIARLSGDRFGFMFEIEDGVEDALRRVENLRARLQAPLQIGDRAVCLELCLGVSMFPADADSAEMLVKNAETALSVAREQSVTAIQFYESRTGDEIRVRRRLRGELEAALQADDFTLYYQPQFDASSGDLTGVEALLRWQVATGERVSIEDLIGIAEDAGQIGALGEWVIRKACLDAASWLEQGLHPFRIAVNISVLQLDYQGFVEAVDQALEDSGIEAQRVELEITETAIMKDVKRVIQRLGQIRERGIHVAVDDFGTGHSSLQYLKRLPINCLKIDQSFVRDVCADAGDAQIVAAMISLGKSLKLRVVAEGVEDEDQLGFLQQHGCDEVQGFLLARPMPPDELVRFVREHATQGRPMPDQRAAG